MTLLQSPLAKRCQLPTCFVQTFESAHNLWWFPRQPYKRGYHRCLDIYRLIDNISLMSKVFEFMLRDAITEHLSLNSPLFTSQQDLQKKRSCSYCQLDLSQIYSHDISLSVAYFNFSALHKQRSNLNWMHPCQRSHSTNDVTAVHHILEPGESAVTSGVSAKCPSGLFKLGVKGLEHARSLITHS